MLSDINPKILIVGGAAIFSILVLFIIFFIFLYQRRHYIYRKEKEDLQTRFLREILKTQLETQEETFHQIGEELHDNIGQLLSSTRMLIGIAERSLTEVPDTLKVADQTLAKAIQDLRMLSKSLNKEWLNQFNIIDNLQAEIERINAARVIQLELKYSTKSLPLNPEAQVILFRVIQEGLQNSIKHADAKNITVDIEVGRMIKVIIRDDGKGFDMNDRSHKGVGLLNMKHRTSILGGTIEWKPIHDNGTEVCILLPQQPETYEY